MLRQMRLVDQWQGIEERLPDDWAEARLELTAADGSQLDRAAALLGPLAPGRLGERLRFSAARGGAGPSSELLRRALARLDEEGIGARLELIESGTATSEAPLTRRTLAGSWDALAGALPDDWSDLYGELELASSDDLERAALLTAPLNPARFGATPGFRFRVARSFGYGASPQMARRCLARLDEDGIPGDVRLLRVLSDTKPVATQGPVWYAGGKVF